MRETADCYIVTGLSAKQKKKLMLADNKIFELGVNDTNTFDELLREFGGDIDIPGYDEELLKVLTANAAEADEMIASYGTFSEEPISRMNNAQPQVAIPQPQTSTQTITGQVEAPQNSQKYIVCPKCGEKIWL